MGKLSQMKISLAKPYPIYKSGESVTGSLEIQVEEKIKINSIRLTLKGFSRVYWTEQRSSGKNSDNSIKK